MAKFAVMVLKGVEAQSDTYTMTEMVKSSGLDLNALLKNGVDLDSFLTEQVCRYYFPTSMMPPLLCPTCSQCWASPTSSLNTILHCTIQELGSLI